MFVSFDLIEKIYYKIINVIGRDIEWFWEVES